MLSVVKYARGQVPRLRAVDSQPLDPSLIPTGSSNPIKASTQAHSQTTAVI